MTNDAAIASEGGRDRGRGREEGSDGGREEIGVKDVVSCPLL